MANALGELFGDIASAIREKTGDAEKMKPAQFPEKISEIETGADVSAVTATAPHVLDGDVFVDADGNPVNGTMKNNGAVLKKLRYSGYDEKHTYTIPEGYHDGTGIVEVECDSEQIVYPSKYRQRLYGTPIRDNDWNLTGYNFLGHVVIDPIPDQYQDVTPVTATAADVRQGKVIVDAQGNEVVGTLVVEQKAPDVIWVGKDSVSNALVGSGVIRYVTFCNHDGTETYGQKSVIAGENCVDPVTAGHMDAPTRESTAQYNYTFSGGWATEPGGGINADALKNVTEDRTVYANFIAAVRYYNARFYSDGQLVATVPTAYGAQAIPPVVPAKDGYTLDGWNPSDLTVYGDTDFNAVWAKLTGYYYITTLSEFPDTALQDMAINKAGTHIAVGMMGTNNPPFVYDISGGTPEIISNGNASAIAYQKVDYNFDESALYAERKTATSLNANRLLKNQIVGGTYGACEEIGAFQGAKNYSRFLRCSPVEDVIACAKNGGDSPTMSLNGVDVPLAGKNSGLGEFSPDGKYFAINGQSFGTPISYMVQIFDVKNATLFRTITFADYVNSVSFNKDGTLIAVGHSNAPYFSVYSVESGERIYSFENVFTASGACCFVFGTNELVIGSGTTVRAFDFTDPSEPQEIENLPVYQGAAIFQMRSNKSGTRIGIMSTATDGIEIWGKI